ncbi:MAG: hypothetical protein HYV45_01160 [Candidatus Moranbacteria bacterium]|nr:hypothetical protein [Candidatus Moranbacteria bacterium]
MQDSFEQQSTSPLSPNTILLQWEAPEHEPLELGPRSRVIVTVLLVLIVVWALYTNSPLMAITFILIGIIGYLSLYREPRIIRFSVTPKGVVAGNELYSFESVQSFFIYTEPPFQNILSLHTEGKLFSHAHIPVPTIDNNELRDVLSQFIPEEEHSPGLIDTLEKLLHI